MYMSLLLHGELFLKKVMWAQELDTSLENSLRDHLKQSMNKDVDTGGIREFWGIAL